MVYFANLCVNRRGSLCDMGPFSGQVAGLVKETKPAAEILHDMVEEAADILTRKLPETVIVE